MLRKHFHVIFFTFQDYKDKLDLLKADLEANVAIHGAWVEHKDLLVAWHYREVDKHMKTKLMAKAKEIYAKHNFEILTVSKRFENKPLDGWDRGISCIQILKWIYGLDWEERVKVCITTQCGNCRILLLHF